MEFYQQLSIGKPINFSNVQKKIKQSDFDAKSQNHVEIYEFKLEHKSQLLKGKQCISRNNGSKKYEQYIFLKISQLTTRLQIKMIKQTLRYNYNKYLQYNKNMDEKWSNTLKTLSEFKNILMKHKMQYVIVLMGAEKAGKTTLANYIAGSDLFSQVDEEGQDVLRVQNELQTIPVVQNILQVILAPNESILFIKIKGFPNQSKSAQHNQKWSLVMDYVLYSLNLIRQQICVSFILVFSLMQVQQNPQLLTQYKNALKNVNEFAKQTHIVLSRLVDEDQFNQFVEITAQNLIEQTPECDYIKQVIQERRIYFFYTQDANKDEQNQMKQNIYASFQPNQVFSTIGPNSLLKQNIGEDQLHTLFEYAYQKLVKCLLLVNYSLIQMLLIAFEVPKDTQIAQKFKNLCGQIVEQNLQFQPTTNLKSKDNIKIVMEIYQTLRKTAKQDKNQFFSKLLSFSNKFYSLWREQLAEKGIISKLQILKIICEQSSQNTFGQAKDSFAIDVFTNDMTGSLEDRWILKVFPKCEQLISPQLAEELKTRASSPKKRKKVIKVAQKNVIPNYDIQYKQFLQQNKTLQQVYTLPISPLKLQFLIDQLNKKRKSSKRVINQQKQVIRKIIEILKVYKCFEQAVKFTWMMPNILGLNQVITQYLEQQMINKPDITKQGSALVLNIYQFFVLANRQKYNESMLTKIQQFASTKNTKNIIKLKQQLQSLKQRQTNIQNQSDTVKTTVMKFFMNYQKIQLIFSKKKQLIDKCIQFQSKNQTQIEVEIVKNLILNGKQLRLAN